MPSRSPRGSSGIFALLGATLLAALLTPVSAGAQVEVPEQVVIIVLDLSGSMNEPFDGSQTKLDVAKSAFAEAFANASDGAVVGLRVYGDLFPAAPPADREQNCTEDTRLVVPPGEAEQEALVAQVQGFEAQGDTAIALALRAASDDIPDGALGTVLLFSDGRDECFDADLDGNAGVGPSFGEDPCVVAAEIAGEGTDLRIDRINTIGFGADAAAETELRCIADSTGGDYTAIETPEDAREVLPELVVGVSDPRDALRLGGTPIDGTPTQDGAPEFDVLDGPAGATDGRYTDTIEMNSERWYLAPGYGPGRGTFTATVFDLTAQEGIGFTMRSYVPETDQTFFEGRGDDDAGVPRRPATSIRCPGCGLTSGDEFDMFWVVSLTSDNAELTGTYDLELLIEGPAFGGLDTACRAPQTCWTEAAVAAAEAEIARLQEEGGEEVGEADAEEDAEQVSEEESAVDPALLVQLEQTRAEAQAARQAADAAQRQRDELTAQLAAAGAEGGDLPLLPLFVGLLGLLAGVASFFVDRGDSTAEVIATPTGSAPTGDAVIGQVVDSPARADPTPPLPDHPAADRPSHDPDEGSEADQHRESAQHRESKQRLEGAQRQEAAATDHDTGGPLEVPEPGWYADPDEDGVLRWWDGSDWTGDTRADGGKGGAP